MAAKIRAADAQAPAGHLGDTRPVPGLQALNAGGNAEVSIVRCASPGFCTAAGDYNDGIGNNGNGHHQAFVATETDFTWGKAVPVVGLAGLSGGNATNITSLSCARAGNCTIGGWYVDPSGNLQPFVASSADGTFGTAHPIFTVSDQIRQFQARVTALSCAEPTVPNSCSAALILPAVPAGGGDPVPEAFLVTETNGSWGPLRPVTGLTGTNVPSGIASLSCWKPGDCMAVGGFGHAGSEKPILAIQEGGSWSLENTIPGLDGRPVIDFNPNADAAGTNASCWAFTSCGVAGIYGDHHGNQEVFVADWVNGEWTTQTLPSSEELNRGGSAPVFDLSCGGAAGSCAVAGQFLTAPADDPTAQAHAFVDSRAAGDWSNAQEILGISNLPQSEATTASCPLTGGCVTGGDFSDTAGHQQAFVSYENTTAGTKDFGSFGGAKEIAGNLNAGGSASVTDISCSFAGECGFGGFYTDASGHGQGFVADQSSATATTLSATATTVAAGNEQDVHITATVTPVAGGTPAGTVTVLANGPQFQTTVCTITLAGGSGDCTLPAGSLDPGTYSFFGNYNGDQQYGGSTSASGGGGGLTMHVVPAPLATSTALTVAPAKVAFGREQAAHLSVIVAGPSGDTPSGKVTIKAGSVTVGVITLARGKGGTALAASKLRPGTYHLTASYGGDPGNKASASGSKTLTVTPEPTSTTLSLSAARIKVGHEQAEHLTVRVKPQTSGIPAGKVTVRAGSATLCVITLKSAKGSCTLAASKLRPGTYKLIASYAGGTPYAASASAKKTLTVTR